VLGSALDLFFPPRCAGCGRGDWPFCRGCIRSIAPIDDPMCRRCGRPTDDPLSYCFDCPPPPVAVSRSPFLFSGPVRSAVHRLKFAGWRGVADALGDAMAAVNVFRADAVTWVPLSRLRLAERGYDQARALALIVGVHLDRPVQPFLRRNDLQGSQARRSGADRRTAMLGAFRSAGRAPPPSVLLVDDVLTTGATAAACAKLLRDEGASQVGLLTAARAISGSAPARYTRSGSRLGLWLPGERLPGSRCQSQAKRPT
jgi:ComF family protein